MIRVLFVCHGNICRSPMAEFVFKDLVEKKGQRANFEIASAATSCFEEGNPVHPGTRQVLMHRGISCAGKTSALFTVADYDHYDYILTADSSNIRNLLRIIHADPSGKIMRLMDFTQQPHDIDDPWYSGKFEAAYMDVLVGCQAFLEYLENLNQPS